MKKKPLLRSVIVQALDLAIQHAEKSDNALLEFHLNYVPTGDTVKPEIHVLFQEKTND